MFHQVLPLFPLSQSYSMSTSSRTLIHGTVRSGQRRQRTRYFQPTGIFEVTRPKPKKKKYKKVDQHVKPVPTTLPEEFGLSERLLATR